MNLSLMPYDNARTLGRYSHVLHGRKRRVTMELKVVTLTKISALCQDLEESKTRIAGLAFCKFLRSLSLLYCWVICTVSYLYFSAWEYWDPFVDFVKLQVID